MSTTSISQKIDLLSGLEKAAFDDVSRVWTGMHSKGIITREVCIKQTGLYTSPMLVRTLVVGLHKEEICSDWVTHQWWALPRVRSGVTSLGPSHGRLCPCGPHRFAHAVTYPCLTKPQPSTRAPPLPASASCLLLSTADLPYGQAGLGLQICLQLSFLLSSQHCTRNKLQACCSWATGLGWHELCCQSKMCFCSAGNRMDSPLIPPNVIYSTGKP